MKNVFEHIEAEYQFNELILNCIDNDIDLIICINRGISFGSEERWQSNRLLNIELAVYDSVELIIND